MVYTNNRRLPSRGAMKSEHYWYAAWGGWRKPWVLLPTRESPYSRDTAFRPNPGRRGEYPRRRSARQPPQSSPKSPYSVGTPSREKLRLGYNPVHKLPAPPANLTLIFRMGISALFSLKQTSLRSVHLTCVCCTVTG
jgi:hypothetical protein